MGIVSAIVAVTALSIAAMWKEYFQTLEADTLAAVSALGEEYLEGGVEYFEKLAERGKLMRAALQYGDAYFDENGDLLPFRWMVARGTCRQRADALKKELEKKRVAE